MSTSKFFFVVFALSFLFSLVSSVSTFKNSQYTVQLSGNGKVPKFSFYLNANASDAWNVQFQQLFEAQISGKSYKKIGPSNVALPSLNWNISESTSDKEKISFTMKGTPKKKGTFESISFVNHLNLSDTNNDTKPSDLPALKFDVLINDYKWTNNTNETVLVLAFSFQGSGGDLDVNKDGDTVTLDGAYFYINTTAISYTKTSSSMWSSTLNAKMVIPSSSESGSDSSSGMIWLVYDKFSGSLMHDPELGFGQGPDPDDGLPGWAVALIVIIIIAVVVAVALGVFLYVRARSKRYQTLE
jgi:hypothetical protein